MRPNVSKVLLALAALPIMTFPVWASEAVVVQVYQDCRIVDTNVVVNERTLSAADSAEVKARVAAASEDPEMAVPKIVQILKGFGIDDVSVSQQGLAGCEPETSGKFVEAVGTYCGADLTHAEVFVDRESFMSRSAPGVTFEEFLKQAVERLRQQEIYDRPVVSIENAMDCEKSS